MNTIEPIEDGMVKVNLFGISIQQFLLLSGGYASRQGFYYFDLSLDPVTNNSFFKPGERRYSCLDTYSFPPNAVVEHNKTFPEVLSWVIHQVLKCHSEYRVQDIIIILDPEPFSLND